jgi:hypothetical protein
VGGGVKKPPFIFSIEYQVSRCPKHRISFLAEAKVFNLNVEKLDLKTVSCHFIGYLDKSKGYHFFLEDEMTRGEHGTPRS